MPRKLKREFDHLLADLYRARTHRLRSANWPSRGSAPKLTKSKIRNTVSRLQDISREAYFRSKEGKNSLRGIDYKRQWHPKRGKGWGPNAKVRMFKKWYDLSITSPNCVYVFWSKKKCLYIGRTLNGKGRPASHFVKYWFKRVTRIDVYGFYGKRQVPKFECLLTHKLNPIYARTKPAQKRYSSNCPICRQNTLIAKEVSAIFRLK